MPNPYPARFLELRAELGICARVLDVGGGGRRLPHVVSVERYWPEGSDLLGDGMRMPIRSGSVDLALCQAVLEHVPEPQRLCDEVFRVLRPGGLLWVEAAFMQPVHQEPHHYFNVTRFGLRHLLREFEVLEEADLGTYDDVVRWIASAIGAPPPVLPFGDWKSARNYWKVASGVAALARKPDRGETT